MGAFKTNHMSLLRKKWVTGKIETGRDKDNATV